MKVIRFSLHALTNLKERDVEQGEVEQTLLQPDLIEPGHEGRQVYMRRYQDTTLKQEMVLRVVVDETETEIIVVTTYKTSQVARYLGGKKS